MTREKASKVLDKLGFGDSRTAGAAISRMPRSVKEECSRALIDGANWKRVAKICDAAGFPGVQAMNVTNFRKGWHQDFLAREERIEAIRRDSETTSAVVRYYTENGGSPAEAGLLAAAELMSGAIAGMGPEMLAQLIADDPKAVFGMTRELARVAELIKKSKDAQPDAAPEDKPAMTAEQRTAAMKEIFGLPT